MELILWSISIHDINRFKNKAKYKKPRKLGYYHIMLTQNTYILICSLLLFGEGENKNNFQRIFDAVESLAKLAGQVIEGSKQHIEIIFR